MCISFTLTEPYQYVSRVPRFNIIIFSSKNVHPVILILPYVAFSQMKIKIGFHQPATMVMIL